MVPMLWFEDTKSITAASEDREFGRAMFFRRDAHEPFIES